MFNADISGWDVSSVGTMRRSEWMRWLVGFVFEGILGTSSVCVCGVKVLIGVKRVNT